VGRYFYEFTLIVERLIYSTYTPSGEEIEKSRELTRKIREEAKNENV
jgi:hypothetical protein